VYEYIYTYIHTYNSRRAEETSCQYANILYTYIHIYTHTYMYVYMYIHIKVGLGISRTSADFRWKAFHRICCLETKRFVRSSVNVILTRQTCGQRSCMSAGSKHRALENYFQERICHIFSNIKMERRLKSRSVHLLINRYAMLFCLHNNEFDEMPRKVDSSENPCSFAKYKTQYIYKCSEEA